MQECTSSASPSDRFTLVAPAIAYLPSYVAALPAGWSPNTSRDVSGEQLAAIRAHAERFLADLSRREGGGIIRPGNGGAVERLPGLVLWMWDGEFCGSINLRFEHGTETLPGHVSGHIGYAVVPWKRRRGYATRALAMMLPFAMAEGFARMLVTCDVDNAASRKAIEANGGVFAGTARRDDFSDEAGKEQLMFWVRTAQSCDWVGKDAPR